MLMTNDTLAITHALRGDLDLGASVSNNARAIIGAILGDNVIGGPISTETLILAKAFRGDYEGADGRLSTNGRAILRAIQGDYVPRATVSQDTLVIIHAIQNNAGSPDTDPLSVTNAEKLALTGIEVGQVVHITDAVQVAGGTQDGVYIFSGGGLHFLIGSETKFIDYSDEVGPLSEPGFKVVDDATVIYYAVSVAATPDLATDWKNASDDTPASITVVTPALQQYTGTDPSDEANWGEL